MSPGATQMQSHTDAYREHCVGDTVGFELYIKIRHDFDVSSAGTSAWSVSAVPSRAYVHLQLVLGRSAILLPRHWILRELCLCPALVIPCPTWRKEGRSDNSWGQRNSQTNGRRA